MSKKNYVTRQFPKEMMQEILWDEHEGVEIVKNEMYDTSRWSIHYELVFGYEGKFYSTSYSRGATECQYEEPFEYESDMITVYEVVPYQKITVDYKHVEL